MVLDWTALSDKPKKLAFKMNSLSQGTEKTLCKEVLIVQMCIVYHILLIMLTSFLLSSKKLQEGEAHCKI